MAGTWMSIVYGFGGVRIRDGRLCLAPFKPEAWERYAFHLFFRERLLKVTVDTSGTRVELEEGEPLEIVIYHKTAELEAGAVLTISA
jgi:trehalose/maltose hydrolase-like predicted phosphorylase